jgi:hypothetical protein
MSVRHFWIDQALTQQREYLPLATSQVDLVSRPENEPGCEGAPLVSPRVKLLAIATKSAKAWSQDRRCPAAHSLANASGVSAAHGASVTLWRQAQKSHSQGMPRSAEAVVAAGIGHNSLGHCRVAAEATHEASTCAGGGGEGAGTQMLAQRRHAAVLPLARTGQERGRCHRRSRRAGRSAHSPGRHSRNMLGMRSSPCPRPPATPTSTTAVVVS